MVASRLWNVPSRCLSEEEFDLLYQSADPDADVVTLVKTIVDRSQFMRRLSLLFILPAKALSVQWLTSAVSKQL
jgi:hypothetical protein